MGSEGDTTTEDDDDEPIIAVAAVVVVVEKAIIFVLNAVVARQWRILPAVLLFIAVEHTNFIRVVDAIVVIVIVIVVVVFRTRRPKIIIL